MPVLSKLRGTFSSLFRKAQLDRDVDQELESYLEMLTREKVEAGIDPEQARRQALIELGGVEQVKERVRQDRVGAGLDTLAQDVRLSLRTMVKNKGFATVAILTLAIGIGATTALFSTVNSVLLRALPFDEPERLVWARKTIEGRESWPVSRLDYFDYREQCRSFEDLGAMASLDGVLTGGSEPRKVRGAYVTWNLFATLRVIPAVGRPFLPAEEKGGAPVVIISYGLWQSRFAGSPEAVGDSIELDGSSLRVVGVMPRGFRFYYDDVDLWQPVTRDGPYDLERDSHSHVVIGRLAPGVTIEQAQDEVDSVAAALEKQYPDTNAAKGLRLNKLHDAMVEDARTILLMLMATTVLVLLIACGNVAGLLLARGQQRLPELALRSALGASRRRLLRQLLSESLILTAFAGTLGIGIAYLLRDLVLRLLPVGRLGIDGPVIDGYALCFALGVTVATGLLTGGLPALKSTAPDLSRMIGIGSRGTSGVPGSRSRNAMVVLQVASAVVLLVAAGLLVRSLGRLAGTEPGFDAENLLTGQLQIQAGKYPHAEQRNRFFSSLLEEVEALPGVDSASLISKLPILNPGQDWYIWPADRPQASLRDQYMAMARFVGPGYFKTMRTPLLSGRDVRATDVAGAPQVVVISEQVARDLFPDRDAVGQEVKIGWESETFEIVGVVGDTRLNGLRRASPAMFMSGAQFPGDGTRIVVRTATDPGLLVEPIRQALRRMDPDALLSETATMHAVIDDYLADFRIVTFALTLFSGIALLLTGIGLYGVLAYHVSRRYHEIGIRLAMGATPADMFGLVGGRGLTMVGAGLLLGIAAAYPATLLVRRLLFEVQPLDPAAYAGTVLFLAAVSLAACLLPAWRAIRINPVEVLKAE